jgi:hypothetical protein
MKRRSERKNLYVSRQKGKKVFFFTRLPFPCLPPSLSLSLPPRLRVVFPTQRARLIFHGIEGTARRKPSRGEVFPSHNYTKHKCFSPMRRWKNDVKLPFSLMALVLIHNKTFFPGGAGFPPSSESTFSLRTAEQLEQIILMKAARMRNCFSPPKKENSNLCCYLWS